MTFTYRIYDGTRMTLSGGPDPDYPSMRLTGQVDSKGERIWECDILSRGRARGVVEYDDLTRRFLIRFGRETVELNEGVAFTVVGNAFENPDKV